jgi:hypothetical protein
MIGPGSFPFPLRRPSSRRRTPLGLAYRRRRGPRRAKKSPASHPEPRNTELVLLHHGPYELPVATVRTRRPHLRALLGDLAMWLAARWAWLRPRAIPVAVAFGGLFLFLAAEHYLGDLARGSEVAARGELPVLRLTR